MRLLRWDEVSDAGVGFKPTKTESTIGKEVFVPRSVELRAVFDRARQIGTVKSPYVIHNERGRPYSASGARSHFFDARRRLGIEQLTLRDIRSKAATDARL